MDPNDALPDSIEQVESLVEQLVTSGQSSLDDVIMKKLKSICKKDEKALQHTFSLLMMNLEKQHCEIR